jgi:thioredoxin-related protein
MLFSSVSAIAQENSTFEINWLSLQKARDTFLIRQKPILLYLHQQGNDSSQIMLDSVLKSRDVSMYLNNYFYSVLLDVNSKEKLKFFNDSTFVPKAKAGVHPLVNYLTGGNNTFPAMVIFRNNGQGDLYTTYYSQTHLFPILIYYFEEAYRTVTFDEYLEYFRMVYPEKSTTGYSMVRSVTKWYTMEEALKLQQEHPKKILIDFYLNERNLSTIMYMRTYNNSVIGNYINEHFYAVRINATGKDTINAFGGSYSNPGTPHPFHQLAVAMLNGQMYFPSLMILDEQTKMLDRIQAYLRPEDIEPILQFYGEDKFKELPYNEFKKKFQSKLPIR